MVESNTVSLASLGIVATSLAAIIWVAKYFASTLSADMREHTKASVELKLAAIDQTKSHKYVARALVKFSSAMESLEKTTKEVGEESRQNNLFMRKLNGKLEKAIIQEVKEQKVKHQHIEKTVKE